MTLMEPELPRHTAPSAWAQSPLEQHSDARPVARTPWQDRISELAKLAAASLGTDGRGSDTGPLIHHHLDAIETILQDPRPELVQEVSKCRSQRNGSHAHGILNGLDDGISNSEAALSDSLEDRCDHEIQNKAMASRLQTLLVEIAELNQEMRRRHAESVEIRDLLEAKCRGLARTVAELEDEVSELQSDLHDDGVELEGIQGTVRGLQEWVQGLRDGQDLARARRVREPRKTWRGWAGGKPSSSEEIVEVDGEAVLDGLNAWMRGWSDVEDGHKIRSRARKSRRERRQEQLSKRRGNPGLSSPRKGR